MLTVAEAFKRFRAARGLSQQAVADKIGVKQGSYTAYETKGAAPTVEKLRKMACEFQVSADYLLGLTDDPRPTNEILAELKSLKEKPAAVETDIEARVAALEAEFAKIKASR